MLSDRIHVLQCALCILERGEGRQLHDALKAREISNSALHLRLSTVNHCVCSVYWGRIPLATELRSLHSRSLRREPSRKPTQTTYRNWSMSWHKRSHGNAQDRRLVNDIAVQMPISLCLVKVGGSAQITSLTQILCILLTSHFPQHTFAANNLFPWS